MKPKTKEEIAERLVIEAEGMVARQRELVRYLGSPSADAEAGKKLLRSFERAQTNFEHTLALLKAAMR